MPHRRLNPIVGTQGSGLYSRFPLTETGVRENSGGFTQAYGTLTAPGAAPTTVESVHPTAPYALEKLRDWERDLDGQPRATPDGPVRILAGDFNSTLDHAPLRRLISSGYRDAADAAGAGLTGTWGPYDGDRIPPVTIDHVLVDRRVGVRDVSVFHLPGSDHRPVYAELSLPRGDLGG
jgi:endonuclease/exonuclease/phosphatase (EEP) superfamily protein YafD